MRFIFQEIAIMDRTPIVPCGCGKMEWGNTSSVYAHGKVWQASSICLSCLKHYGWTINPDAPIEGQSLASRTYNEGKF